MYRRDSIDKTHYPVFHQMEAFRVFTPDDVSASGLEGVVLRVAEPAALQVHARSWLAASVQLLRQIT